MSTIYETYLTDKLNTTEYRGICRLTGQTCEGETHYCYKTQNIGKPYEQGILAKHIIQSWNSDKLTGQNWLCRNFQPILYHYMVIINHNEKLVETDSFEVADDMMQREFSKFPLATLQLFEHIGKGEFILVYTLKPTKEAILADKQKRAKEELSLHNCADERIRHLPSHEIEIQTSVSKISYILSIAAPTRRQALEFAQFITTDQINSLLKNPAQTFGVSCILYAAKRKS